MSGFFSGAQVEDKSSRMSERKTSKKEPALIAAVWSARRGSRTARIPKPRYKITQTQDAYVTS